MCITSNSSISPWTRFKSHCSSKLGKQGKGVKQEYWVTSGEEWGGGRKRKNSEKVEVVRPQHRKVADRTLEGGSEGGGEGGESRAGKRREREGGVGESVTVSKRLKGEDGGVGEGDVYYPLPLEDSLAPAHPTWPGCLMPPPTHPATQVHHIVQ